MSPLWSGAFRDDGRRWSPGLGNDSAVANFKKRGWNWMNYAWYDTVWYRSVFKLQGVPITDYPAYDPANPLNKSFIEAWQVKSGITIT